MGQFLPRLKPVGFFGVEQEEFICDCNQIAVSEYHWPAEKFGAAAVSYFCDEHYNERLSLDNLAYDEEQARIANERFDRMAALLREAYPTRIPEEWTR